MRLRLTEKDAGELPLQPTRVPLAFGPGPAVPGEVPESAALVQLKFHAKVQEKLRLHAVVPRGPRAGPVPPFGNQTRTRQRGARAPPMGAPRPS